MPELLHDPRIIVTSENRYWLLDRMKNLKYIAGTYGVVLKQKRTQNHSGFLESYKITN